MEYRVPSLASVGNNPFGYLPNVYASRRENHAQESVHALVEIDGKVQLDRIVRADHERPALIGTRSKHGECSHL